MEPRKATVFVDDLACRASWTSLGSGSLEEFLLSMLSRCIVKFSGSCTVGSCGVENGKGPLLLLLAISAVCSYPLLFLKFSGHGLLLYILQPLSPICSYDPVLSKSLLLLLEWSVQADRMVLRVRAPAG